MTVLIRWACAVVQFLTGLFIPMLGVAVLRWFTKPRRDAAGRPLPTAELSERCVRTFGVAALGGIATGLYWAFIFAIYFGTFIVSGGLEALQAMKAPPTVTAQESAESPADTPSPGQSQPTSDPSSPPTPPPGVMVAGMTTGLVVMLTMIVLAVAGRVIVSWQGADTAGELRAYGIAVRFRMAVWRLVVTVGLLALSLLPLSALLLVYPALNPQETVLTDAASGRGSWFGRAIRRVAAVVTGLAVLFGLLAVSVEGVSRLMPGEGRAGLLPEKGSFAPIAKFLMPAPAGVLPLGQTDADRKAAIAKLSPSAREAYTTPLYTKLPPAMVEHWPFVILGIYVLDVLVLLLIGKVPLAYNLRNLRVRWLTNGLTAVAFMVVVGFLAFLLAFVNGMNKMTQNSGIPGNVFVLSDGATDEIFSNLGYGDIDNVERAVADVEQVMDSAGKPVLTDDDKEVWRQINPLRIRQMEIDGKQKYLANKETFYSVNQPVPNSTRRRFVQLRTHEDAAVAAAVHSVELYPGGRWFGASGVDEQSRIQCVLGEGMAKTLGGDAHKPQLVVGDTFELGDMTWVVVGIMKSEGKTFGSEIWAKRFSRIYTPFGKDKYTTIVMRTEKDTGEASRTFANYLSKKYTQQKLKAFSEPEYYAELTKTNDTLLIGTIIVCLVMAIGGVFGMMTTMFASIAQRIKDIGVLRLLGFKRWQVMVSFLLESLTVAAVGGGLGVILAWLTVNGRTASSTLSAGGGGGPGGKSITLIIDVDWQVMAMGLLFALAMGRLGGLVPALSAMRMKILDSLR